MATARQRAEWSRTCAILAIIHNKCRAENDPPIENPESLNPFASDADKPAPPAEQPAVTTEEAWQLLEKLCVDDRRGKGRR